ncbi:MAG: elongation factor P [Deltaproteobacteria bacterium]|nr:elongation factor P [Deltaproteobacteria bacterium]MBW2413012.1 elongation factor P [Deltaproteobacteria bacterium]
MPTIDTSKMRPGTRVELDGEPFVITQYQHVKPGKGGAFVRLKLKSLISGSVLDRTLKGGDSLPQADVAERTMQYLYDDGEKRVFMDQESYEQVEIAADQIDGVDLLAENCEVRVLLHNDRPVGVELPNFVVLEITETDPPEKGGRLKPATVETGAQIQVPSFIDRGERIKIDTRERKYVERA